MPASRTNGRSNRNTVTSMSSRLQITMSKHGESGRRRHIRSSLTAAQISVAKELEAREEAERRESLSRQERRDLSNLRDLPDSCDDGDGWVEEVLHGRAAAQISHAGEALPQDAELADTDLFQGLRENSRRLWRSHRYPDQRKRRNRTQLQVDAFTRQMAQLADAYLELGVDVAKGEGLAASYDVPVDAEVQEEREILVVDVFSTSHQDLRLVRGDACIASACVRRGWIPVSPWTPTVIITIRALEVYRVAHLRCPRLGIQAFMRALCDIHGVAPHPWLGAQFSVAFNVYLAIQAEVDKHVQVVQGEPELKIPFMATFDGNNSLSRFERREKVELDEDGTCAPGTSKERLDNRVAPGDYYLPREEVKKWGKEGLRELMKDFSVEREGDEGEAEELGCSERWQNMKEDVTARAYGMYDETGFFPALCRHGFVLKVVDMVKSGELSDYPLSIVYHILDVLGEVALGYDVGCKLIKTVRAHPALRDLARDKNFRALVSAFHGHGHNRLCGLDNLMTYVEGVGLEALEGCESFFSKSNALASTTHYASRFHRQQAITTYYGLTTVLCNKYRRALEIKATYAALRETMRELGEPEQETLEMEYFQKLVNLQDAEERIDIILGLQLPVVADAGTAAYAEAAKATRRIKTQRRHALELQTKILVAVQDLEVRLDVTRRWVPEDEKWAEISVMVRRRRYQHALDHLQGLIISRMFELAKCNMSGTGYKLRKHITKALQARSKAVKNTITTYNEVAQTMTPPKPTLDWEQVVEYAFLADFDLLREGREDIHGELWAQPAGRAAMDQHYKLLRADKEIQRLNVEIRRLVTYMADEAGFLSREEDRLREEGEEAIAVQVGLLRMERVRFTSLHRSRLRKLSQEPSFTGSLVSGVSVCQERHTPVARIPRDSDVEMRVPSPPPLEEENGGAVPADGDEEDVESDDDDGELAEAFLNVVRIAHDDTIVREDT
ncbi:hypothetical protein DFH09DRAFT_1306980 [Mycena vulgaris]|nr:hypothetical protein DFH09DRAFT_1306980 [Mycena vulgaris]